MKIALFGSTGRVGGHVVKKALAAGHSVNALVRVPEKLDAPEGLTVIQGDVRNQQDVAKTISGMDLVLSTLGTGIKKSTTMTEAFQHIILQMKEKEIDRIVTIGTAGILESRIEPGKLRYEDTDSHRSTTFAVEEHHKVYDLLKSSRLDWTIVCPTYLPDGEAQGNYRVERDYVPVDGKQITVGDTANFALDELLGSDYVGYRVGIAY